MSFIWKYAEFTPTQISSLSLLECVQVILKGCAKALISTNTGWSLDTTHHPSATGSANDPDTIDPINTNKTTYASTYPCYAYYFKNSVSNDKFMMLYNGDNTSNASRFPLYDSNLNSLKYIVYSSAGSSTSSTVQNTVDYCYAGMMCSIIKGSYTEDFGEDCSQLAFLPTHATRLLRFQDYNNSSGSYCLAGARASSNWGAWARFYWGSSSDGNCIVGIYRPKSLENSAMLPTRIWGKIYSSLYNVTDTDDYGAIKLWNASNSYQVDGSYFNQTAIPLYSGWSNSITSRQGLDYPDSRPHVSALAHGSAGSTWLSGTLHIDIDSSTKNQTICQTTIPVQSSSSSNNINDYSSNSAIIDTTRHTLKIPNPIIAFNYNNNTLLDMYGIVPGCGIKGTLDQNAISFIPGGNTRPYTQGTLIDDGYTIVTSVWGVCLGWDPSNDPTDNPWYVAPA